MEVDENVEQEPIEAESPEVESPEVESPEAVEEYTPNFSYSVRDEEFEFNEALRDAVKSKEVEEHLRELYTKSKGLDGYKERYTDLEQQASALVGGYQTLKQLRDSGDIRGLLGALNVDSDTILDYANAILDERELPEEHRQLLEQNRQLNEKFSSVESQLKQMQMQSADSRIDSDINELKTLLVNEDYKPVAEAMRSAGLDMQKEVLKEGHLIYLETQKEPSVASVVKSVADKYSRLLKISASQNKPVLPSVSGSGNVPVAQKIKSIADLKKLAASM